MPAELDQKQDGTFRMAWAGEMPWHGVGTEITEEMPPAQWQEIAGLNYQVEKKATYTVINGTPYPVLIPDTFALVRDDDNGILGTCSKKWEPLQNWNIFQFFHAVIEKTRSEGLAPIKMSAAGAVQGGKWVWATAKIEDPLDLGGEERLEQFLLFYVPHVPGHRIRIHRSPIRTVCWNTLAMNIRQTDQMGGLTYDHTQQFIVDNAVQAYIDMDAQIKAFAEKAKIWMKTPVTENQLRVATWKSYRPADQFADDAGDLFDDWAESKRYTAVMDLFEGQGQGSTLPSAHGTLWGAYNAVTEHLDHHARYRRPETRFASLTSGVNSRVKRRMETEIDDLARTTN